MMRGEYCSIHTAVLSCLRCLEQASGLISARFLDMPGLATMGSPLPHFFSCMVDDQVGWRRTPTLLRWVPCGAAAPRWVAPPCMSFPSQNGKVAAIINISNRILFHLQQDAAPISCYEITARDTSSPDTPSWSCICRHSQLELYMALTGQRKTQVSILATDGFFRRIKLMNQ